MANNLGTTNKMLKIILKDRGYSIKELMEITHLTYASLNTTLYHMRERGEVVKKGALFILN